jgi:hypothetical protein
MNIAVFCCVTLYNLVDTYRCFGGTYIFNFPQRDGGRLLRNVGTYLTNYMASHTKTVIAIHISRYENFSSK